MPNTIVIGMQWGDEGKGAFIDRLSEKHDVIIRYQGGGNAGHTVVINDETYKLHLIPSGILRKDKLNIIGNNVVFDPIDLVKEINSLQERGIKITPSNFIISDRAHLTLTYHKKLDGARGGKVGTTGRGIGPTYADKITRTGIRACDLFDTTKLIKKITENTKITNHMMAYYGADPCPVSLVLEEILNIKEKIIPFIHKDIGSIILEKNGSLLYEGAQGTLLDIDHGTFPFVTSSNPTIGGAYTGTGVYIPFNNIIGILKAYTTRVGNGPFPTEQDNKIGEKLRKRGVEFGTTTGRPRRCGWLDLFAAKYAARVNGITEISLTKLDVLDEEDPIKVCVSYTVDGKEVDYFPITHLDKCVPVYKDLPGWKKDISKVRKPEDLPENTRKYIKNIEDYLGIPVKRTGVGQRRDQTIEF